MLWIVIKILLLSQTQNVTAATRSAPACRQLVRIEGENLLVGVLRSHLKACESAEGKIELEARRLPHSPRRVTLDKLKFEAYEQSIESAKVELASLFKRPVPTCLHPIRVVFPQGAKEKTYECCEGHTSLWIAQSLDDMVFVLSEPMVAANESK